MPLTPEQRFTLETHYQEACDSSGADGRHWALIALLNKMGIPVITAQDAIKRAEQLLYGQELPKGNDDISRYLKRADEEE